MALTVIGKRSISLRQLRFLVSLDKHQHFGRAAQHCSVTQSTVSLAIKNLENILGVKFAERTNRKVLMTPVGKELADHARAVLAEMDKLVDVISQQRQALSSSLRLGVIPTISPFALPKVLPKIRRAHPKLRLSVKEGLSDDIYQALLDGELDLILLALPYELERLEVLPIFKDPFLLAYHPQCGMAMKNFCEDNLKNGSLLLLQDGHCLRDHALSACDIRYRDKLSPYTTSSLHTLAQMVANNLGVTFMPKIAINSGLLNKTAIKLRTLPATAYRTIGFAWYAGSIRREEYLLFADYFRVLDPTKKPARH